MALRRVAHENNATSPPSRLSFGAHRSPADTPSISSSIPFDWEAARARAPPPYSTPLKQRPRKSAATSTPSHTRKAIVRKKGLLEKIKSLPSQIAFEIALFPNNIPFPTQKVSARIIGGAIHFLHFWILASHDNDDGWDNVSGVKNTAWFDWSTPITTFLIAVSVFNSYSLALCARNYKFHHRTDPLASPHAKFVVTKLDLVPVEQPSLPQRIRSNVSYAFSYSWRWLLGMQPPNRRTPHIKDKTTRVQELDIWEPTELELELFSIYSPAHALLWFGMGSSSWILALLVMVLVSLQLNALIYAYNLLIKDKQLIAAETMKEYNDVFVYPRIHPIRRDVAVMTHQSEIVNVWE